MENEVKRLLTDSSSVTFFRISDTYTVGLMSKRKPFNELSRSQAYKRLKQHSDRAVQAYDNTSESSDDFHEPLRGNQHHDVPIDAVEIERYENDAMERVSTPENDANEPVAPPENDANEPVAPPENDAEEPIFPPANNDNNPVAQPENEVSDREAISSPDDVNSDSEPSPSDPESDQQGNNDDQRNTRQKLSEWIVKSGISRDQTSSLLNILREVPELEDLPKTRETMVGTPKEKIVLQDCAPGYYHHFGLKNGILKALQQSYVNLPNDSVIKVSVNIDGVSLFNSSKIQFIPILGHACNLLGSSVFKIGVYEGVEKPENVEDFLRPFVTETRELSENGIDYQVLSYPVLFATFQPSRLYLTPKDMLEHLVVPSAKLKAEERIIDKRFVTYTQILELMLPFERDPMQSTTMEELQ
ncbi:hypothetical protein B566_EDAN012759 [Ephemera danica]|nr:hypothetical protein B566_EDAN012759 [Ephemera danica]